MAVNIGGGLALPAAESNVLQSFSDATAGRSLQLYWGVRMVTDAGSSYALTRDGGTSYIEYTGAPVTINFDVTINKSTIFQGIGYVDVSFKIAATAGANTITNSIYHVAVGETLISSVPVNTEAANGNYNYKQPLTITKKHFKPGDILRLKSVLTRAGAATVQLFHDPNTAGDELKLWMPVVNLE